LRKKLRKLVSNFFHLSQEKAAEILESMSKKIQESEKERIEKLKKLNQQIIEQSQEIQIKLAQGYDKVSSTYFHIPM
jgi:hypothetical protein